MRIKKVKLTNAGKISIVYEKLSQTGFWDEYLDRLLTALRELDALGGGD